MIFIAIIINHHYFKNGDQDYYLAICKAGDISDVVKVIDEDCDHN